MDFRKLFVYENGDKILLLKGNFKNIKKYILNDFNKLTDWMCDPSDIFHLNDKGIKKELKEFKEFQKDIKRGVRSSKNFNELKVTLYELSNYISWWGLRIEEEEEEEEEEGENI